MAELCFDSYGNPFILFKDQDRQRRLTGNDAIKVNDIFRQTHPEHLVPKFVIFMNFTRIFLGEIKIISCIT